MKHRRLCILLILLALALMTSCKRRAGVQPGSRNQDGYPVAIIDATGERVVIPVKPQRIIVAGTPLYSEILLDLGQQSRLVAVVDSSNNPDAIKKLAKIGNYLHPNLEMIIALKPDVVFGAFGPLRNKLQQAGIHVVLGGRPPYGNINSTEALYQLISDLDLVVNGNRRLSREIIKNRKQAIARVVAGVTNRHQVSAAVLYVTQNRPPYVQGKDSLVNEVLRRLNARNVFADIASQEIDFEILVKRNPEVIITDPSQLKFIHQNDKLRPIRALKNGKVYAIPASNWTSSRIHRTFAQIARFLHGK